ncbi:unnamed protein product [Agarophyton chilense]
MGEAIIHWATGAVTRDWNRLEYLYTFVKANGVKRATARRRGESALTALFPTVSYTVSQLSFPQKPSIALSASFYRCGAPHPQHINSFRNFNSFPTPKTKRTMDPSITTSVDYNSIPKFVRQNLTTLRKFRKSIAPYLPLICRILLMSTFIEDGIRVLFEMRHQVDFLHHEYYLPAFIATLMLLSNIAISFISIAVILAGKRVARGMYENLASYALIACVVYQQVLYGRHSPIGSGNIGFLIRNLCLSGSLLLITCQSRLAQGRSALPLGLLDGQADKQTTVAYLQLASRIMLVLLGLEFVTTLGVFGTLLAIPVIFAVLVGFKLEISGLVLFFFYLVHNILNSAFWSVKGTYVSQIMQYEFFQTLSIMGGLLLLIITGPGAISVDEMRSRKAF